jgi:hypothetical protein
VPLEVVTCALLPRQATFTENLQQSKDALVALRDAVPEKVAAVGEAVKHSDAVVIATAALTEVRRRCFWASRASAIIDFIVYMWFCGALSGFGAYYYSPDLHKGG